MLKKPSWLLPLTFLCLLHPLGFQTQAVTFSELKESEKIALSLTGRPLSKDQRTQIISGKLDRKDLVEQLSKSPAFVDHLARFWLDKMGVANRLSITEMLLKGRGDKFYYTLFGNQEFIGLVTSNAKDNRDDAGLDDIINRLNRKQRKQLSVRTCGDKQAIFHEALNATVLKTVTDVIANGKWPDEAGTALKGSLEKYKTILQIHQEYSPACESGELVAVKPFWDEKSERWLAPKRLLDPAVCGSDLSLCWVRDSINDYQTLVDEYFTMEPGYLIAQTVAEDKAFSTILTTTSTVANDSAAYFFQKHMPLNNAINNYPGGAYQETSERWTAPHVTRNPQRFWVERTPQHSGVLTTFAYQMVTNGRRAKANRLYETFLCSRFTVPQGAAFDPLDDNPDLRKRAYCSNCHRTLEPMADFFNRWPLTGRVTMEYYDDAKIDDNGSFQGETGTGVGSYGKIASESEAFQRCSVRRAFEFLHGRELSQSEANVLIPRYQAIYESSGRNLRTVLKAMIAGAEFSEAQGGL